jgi:hypothetical protein
VGGRANGGRNELAWQNPGTFKIVFLLKNTENTTLRQEFRKTTKAFSLA